MQAAALSLTPSDLSAQLCQGTQIDPGTLRRAANWFRLEVRTIAADQVRLCCDQPGNSRLKFPSHSLAMQTRRAMLQEGAPTGCLQHQYLCTPPALFGCKHAGYASAAECTSCPKAEKAVALQLERDAYPATASHLLTVAAAKRGTPEETTALLAALLRAHGLRVRFIRCLPRLRQS